jgi:CHAD domain-containing protein
MDDRTALLVLLRQRLTTLIEAMPAAQAGDVRSVHQARVATRRLREALPVIGAAVSARSLGRVGRQVRRMTRALGPVRELDVALAHLDELGARDDVSPRAIARVRQALASDRLERRQEMLAAITPSKVEKLRQRLGHLGSDQAPQPTTVLVEASNRVGTRAGRLVRSIDRAGGLYSPTKLHAVRIAAKKLRYALEIERELTRSRATARISQLKRLQDLLGRMHDFEILIDRTRQVQTEVAGDDRRLAGELDGLIRILEEECRQHHGLYMRRRASILKLCEMLTTPGPSTAVA